MQDVLSQMVKRAVQAALNAYVPLCQFSVGACIRTERNELFSGCNWENVSMPLSQCAETSALSAMITASGHTKITEIVLVADDAVCTPCGGCRQRLLEFSDQETVFYSYNKEGSLLKSMKLIELLPEAFTFVKTNLSNSPCSLST